MYPGYFALVMATGIVSISSYLLGMTSLAWSLFIISIISYAALWFFTFARLFLYYPDFFDDLADHSRGAGFFTIVAGTCILGNQFVLIGGDVTSATILWFLGLILWLILMYAFFTAVFVNKLKPDLENGLHGGWFITVVATQSVSILGTLVAPGFTSWHEPVLFFTLALYLLGGMLYMIILSLVFYRLAFFSLTPKELTPLYWVTMGAAAITTLAGARLILNASQWTFLAEILPFLKGFTFFFWATATWWIPLLLILFTWRHIYKRFPLGYEPQYWSLVFPLGMYTASTLVFAQGTGLAVLDRISGYFIYAALFAWLLTFVAMAQRLMRRLIGLRGS